jgi:hypothetical protein
MHIKFTFGIFQRKEPFGELNVDGRRILKQGPQVEREGVNWVHLA